MLIVQSNVLTPCKFIDSKIVVLLQSENWRGVDYRSVSAEEDRKVCEGQEFHACLHEEQTGEC